jgi:GTP-binding protein Era
MAHKAGFVNIIGNPNVGKSTLTNALVGERLSIITAKAQTTRHRIFAILNEPDFQMVISDTPGIIRPAYKLQEGMMSAVAEVFQDADIFLYVTEPNDPPIKDERYLEKLQKVDTPLIIVLNKIDTTDQDKIVARVEQLGRDFPKADIIPISALNSFGIDQLKTLILKLLPESPPYFDKDTITDRSERFFISEIVREKILETYDKEIPYSVEVIIDEFKVEPTITKIEASIIVSRESQKGIIIGHKGKNLTKVGTAARKDIEQFLDTKVFINLHVKVKKNWRESDTWLKRFGYKN